MPLVCRGWQYTDQSFANLEGQLASQVNGWPCYANLAKGWPLFPNLAGPLARLARGWPGYAVLAKACRRHARLRLAVTRFIAHRLVWFVLLMSINLSW